MKLTLPTMLTLLRIVLIPVLVIVFYSPLPDARIYATGIFMLAGFSDWLDGYLARRMGLFSRFGAFLDPVADKLMVAVAMVMLLQENGGILFMLCTAVIIGREITISALREWMAELGQQANVAVSMIGKIKTSAQMLAITLLLYQSEVAGYSMYELGLWTLYLAVILTFLSMIQYLIAAWPSFNEEVDKGA